VLICAKVGDSNKKGYRRWCFKSDNSVTEDENEVNLVKKIIQIEVERARRQIHRRKRVNRKHRGKHEKVGPFLYFNLFVRVSMLLLERTCLKVINGIGKKTYKMGISIFQNLKYAKKMVKKYNIFDESKLKLKLKQWLDKVISSHTGKVYLTCRYMNGILISLLLVQQNIERNPGERKNVNLEIVTYNCNGLQNKVELGRVLNKAARMVENNSIVLLQETHIINDEDIRQRWRNNFEVNGNTTNRAGVITLFPLDYKPLWTFKNVNGRYIISVLQNDRMKILVANVYLPNDHKESEDIVVEIYEKILETVEIHPDAYIIIGGDINTCIGSNDSMNRAGSKIEEKVSEKISNYNQICNLTDGYRG
jgi:hypothetical protein